MRWFAAILLAGGTVAAMLGGARPEEPVWPMVTAGMLALGLGTLLWRMSANGSTVASMGRTDQDAHAIVGTLRELREAVGEMQRELSGQPSAEVLRQSLERLSELERSTLSDLAEAVPAVASQFNAARFADLLGSYSAAERHLRRAWSAAADDHSSETSRSLSQALDELDQTIAMLDGWSGASAGAGDVTSPSASTTGRRVAD